MVTSNKQADKKVVKMDEQNNVAVVIPQRTLLGEVNQHITCPLCRGYYVDATTIVECLHSFCRSCIIKHLQAKSYCPVCEMMINSAKPNIKLDKALQDIVYKLVPGLFQKEMERRQTFYASRPGPAATATPEQRGEDTERIIFSPEDVISFSLEYCDVTDTDSISSKSSDCSETQVGTTSPRRFLQCPAVVNICHLKKFLSMKFDIDSTQFAIDILYKRVPVPDYYTLMDIAYIYNWKRNEPMRFFYQITDYVAIRKRLLEINRKTLFGDRKASPAPTEDTNSSSPAPNLNDQVSEASSGTDSPMPEENVKQTSDVLKIIDTVGHSSKILEELKPNKDLCMSPKKNEDEVEIEKSQFLNSFELTAKSNCLPLKTSPVKVEDTLATIEGPPKYQPNPNVDKMEERVEPSKRKFQATPHTPELKKLRVEIEKAKISSNVKKSPSIFNLSSSTVSNKADSSTKTKDSESSSKNVSGHSATHNMLPLMSGPAKDTKHPLAASKHQESPGVKRTVSGSQSISSPKRKPPTEVPSSMPPPTVQKTVSPLKLPIPKPEGSNTNLKSPDLQKPAVKKMPDLKPSVSMPQSAPKMQPVSKVRMDLLANNSDPTCDRSKILSQVTNSLGTLSPGVQQQSGDPLKSLFDSCEIKIPSSLSITLTDQKLDAGNPGEAAAPAEPKKSMMNKNLAGVSNTAHKVPSPQVHNYIEILKLPDTEAKKQGKPENIAEVKPNQPNKPDATPAPTKPPTKSSESSAKGPVPNLKPISDTKLAKQSGNFASPITFQQIFQQQLESLQSDKKGKGSKSKAQVPKLMPATPKSFNVANKPNTTINKPTANSMPVLENKPSTALDLSTPHNIQNQLLTMQSIDNLAKKQSLPNKGLPSMPQSNAFPGMANRPLTSGVNPLRIPSTPNMIKSDKSSAGVPLMHGRHEMSSNKSNPIKAASNVSPSVSLPGYQMAPHSSPSTAQPSPRSQTRSPSSSPKLVIAEEKQAGSSTSEQNINQSNQISSTQISSMISQNNDLSKVLPGPSKILPKPLTSAGKMPGIRQALPTGLKPTLSPSTEYLLSQTRPQFMAHHQNMMQFRHQMEMTAWAQRQLDMYKRSNMAHQIQNEFNKDDKQ